LFEDTAGEQSSYSYVCWLFGFADTALNPEARTHWLRPHGLDERDKL